MSPNTNEEESRRKPPPDWPVIPRFDKTILELQDFGSFMDRLYEAMHNALITSIFGGAERNFLPAEALQTFTSEEIIRWIIEISELRFLPEQQKNVIITTLHRTSRRVFAIWAYCNLSVDVLNVLIERSITDEKLPLNEDHVNELGLDISQKRKLTTQFITNQSKFLVVFFAPNEHKEWTLDWSIPIRYEREKGICGKGAFSEVYVVRVHQGHHGFNKVSHSTRVHMMGCD